MAEKLKPEETRKFVSNAFRDGVLKTTGTEINKLMPPVSRFGGSGRAKKKQGVIEKLKGEMKKKIVKFYFKKVDGSVREAYGTLNEKLMPAITGTDNRKKNDTVQTYYDTERQEFRCFKKANLMSIA